MRGPEKQYDVSMRLTITHKMDEFLEAMSELQGVNKQEVIRRMIDSFYPYSLVQYVEKKEK